MYKKNFVMQKNPGNLYNLSMLRLPSFDQIKSIAHVYLKHLETVDKWCNRIVVVLSGALILSCALTLLATNVAKYFLSKKPSPPPVPTPPVPMPPHLPPLLLPVKISDLEAILVRLKTKDRNKLLAALGALSNLASRYKYRSEEHERIAKVFYKYLPGLSQEDLFPMGEAKEEIKQLFAQFAQNMNHIPHWDDPAIEELCHFCTTLTPAEEEQFLKVVPLSLVPAERVAGIQEMSRRFSLGQIEGQCFKDHFGFYFLAPRFFISNGASAFLRGISLELLMRLLKDYSKDFYIDFQVYQAFKEIPSTSDAYQKLMLFARWYREGFSNWSSNEKAYRLIILLAMAHFLLSRLPGKNVQLAWRTREMSGSKQLFLTPSMIKDWIPEEYRSWTKTCSDAQLNPVEELRQYFFDP